MSIVTSNQEWICFINGIEVPIISAATTTTANQLATAQATLAYSPFLSKLPKHTKLTLFSIDSASSKDPRFEFDGVIQGVSWRKDKLGGNTALFLLAHSDGIIWSNRKKFNFYLDNAFGVDRFLSQAQDNETHGTTAQNPIFDHISKTLATANGDGGKAATLFLTHLFNVEAGKFDGTMNYVDSGAHVNSVDRNIDVGYSELNKRYYAHYIQRYYKHFNTLRKVCRIPIPDKYKRAFQYQLEFGIVMNTLSSLQGEVNFWNFATYLCERFAFEVYDVPDANYVKLKDEDIKHINKAASNPESIFAEFIIKPRAPFGPIPLCNIIFPDQVLDKSFFRNFQSEITRVNTSQLMMAPGEAQVAGLSYNFYQGPHFQKNEQNSYFSSYDIGDVARNPDSNTFLKRSQYEEEFGVNSKYVELPELAARMFATKAEWGTIQKLVNHEFLIAYTDKVSFSMQVSPDVDIVPGMSMLVLDENGEHIIAYCYGREKTWDKNGQTVINLKLSFPRPYDTNMKAVADITDPFDPHDFPETSAKDLSIMSEYIGSKFIDPKKDIIDYTHNLMQTWHRLGCDALETKRQIEAIRKRSTYNDYLDFHGCIGKYIHEKLNVMPKEIIDKLELRKDAAKMTALQYTYSTNGFLNPQKSIDNSDEPPSYQELNTPGEIIPSPFIAGIVNCHNRYLMKIGNLIN